MKCEFEEKSYEGPLYNQLERQNALIFTPGQVLESTLGFDHAVWLTNAAIWETLGYDSPPAGAILPYFNWPSRWGPRDPHRQLPPYRLNLFLQAKRPVFYKRKPRSIKRHDGVAAPLWSFEITKKQQRLLEVLASRLGRKAHVAYACAAFHTNLDLFTHTRAGTVVANSTFPSVAVLRGHDAWYYDHPGAGGVANPNPEAHNELPLLGRLSGLAEGAGVEEGLTWLDTAARLTIAAVAESVTVPDAIDAQFANDVQTLARISERYQLDPSLQAYAQVVLFALRYDLSWLIVTK